jgi:hypothetical protein
MRRIRHSQSGQANDSGWTRNSRDFKLPKIASKLPGRIALINSLRAIVASRKNCTSDWISFQAELSLYRNFICLTRVEKTSSETGFHFSAWPDFALPGLAWLRAHTHCGISRLVLSIFVCPLLSENFFSIPRGFLGK